MFTALQTKVIEFSYRLQDALRREEGQTTVEYTLMTMVGAALAIGIAWLAISGVVSGAITTIADEVTGFAPFTPAPAPAP